MLQPLTIMKLLISFKDIKTNRFLPALYRNCSTIEDYTYKISTRYLVQLLILLQS